MPRAAARAGRKRRLPRSRYRCDRGRMGRVHCGESNPSELKPYSGGLAKESTPPTIAASISPAAIMRGWPRRTLWRSTSKPTRSLTLGPRRTSQCGAQNRPPNTGCSVARIVEPARQRVPRCRVRAGGRRVSVLEDARPVLVPINHPDPSRAMNARPRAGPVPGKPSAPDRFVRAGYCGSRTGKWRWCRARPRRHRHGSEIRLEVGLREAVANQAAAFVAQCLAKGHVADVGATGRGEVRDLQGQRGRAEDAAHSSSRRRSGLRCARRTASSRRRQDVEHHWAASAVRAAWPS